MVMLLTFCVCKRDLRGSISALLGHEYRYLDNGIECRSTDRLEVRAGEESYLIDSR